MSLRNFEVNLDETIYQAALERAQGDGKPLEQVLTDLVTAYASGETGGVTAYTVQAGDTLAQIARKVYGDPHKYPVIQNANNLTDPGRIWVGQVLVIPHLTGTSPAPVTPTPAPAPTPPSPPTPPQPPSSTPEIPSTPAPAPTPPSPPTPPQPPLSAPEIPSTPAPPAQPTVADYVNAMPAGLRSNQVAGVHAVYQFQLSGDGGGTWTVTVSNQAATVAQGQTASPSVTIQMSGNDFIKLSQGSLNTVEAYQRGQVTVRGDLNLAAQLPKFFAPWSNSVQVGSGPLPSPSPTPTPSPSPTPSPQPAPSPAPSGGVNSTLLNGSFDDYQPYVRDGEAKVWKESQFPERYGANWTLNLISEKERRIHLMDSGVFGQFTQKYFRGGGRDYHIEGKHSQVVTSRYGFDLVFKQMVAAEPGRTYTFGGSIVSFYKGTSGERADGKIFKTLGIDPAGGQDWSSPTVVWGDRDGKDNEWRYPKIRATAQANSITVFIRLENVEDDVGETELNIIHLDDFKLE